MFAFLFLLFAFASVNSAAHENWPAIRQQIASTFHIPQPLPPLAANSYGKFSPAPDVAADRVSFATAESLRIPAIVYHPAGATIEQHPALIIVNREYGDKSCWYNFWAGILYARAGAVVLTYDPIGEYERNKSRRSGTGQALEYVAPDDMARRLAGLFITDVMQAVSYLADRKDVDPKRIAVIGYSLGAFVASLACAIDSRIHGCVLTGGADLDGPGGFWDTRSNRMTEAIPYRSLTFLGDRAAIIFALNAKRGPTLVFNGSGDRAIDVAGHGPDFFADLRKRTIAALGSSKDIFDFAFAARGGHEPYFLTKPVAIWLEDKLKFPNWTRKQIESMPETQIGLWVAANHAILDTHAPDEPLTRALGNNIPALARDNLYAVPEVVWQSQIDSYVYESWLDRAKSAIAQNAR